MHTATILSWVLASAPESSTPTATPPRATVELEHTDDSVQVTARDTDGEVSAELFLWTDGEGRLRFDAAWPDGLYLSVIDDGEDATIDTDDQAEAAARLELLDVTIREATARRWVPCVFGILATGAACAAAQPVWCVGGAVVAACECMPLTSKKLEDIECPGF
jgi:hypothetical protein